MDLSAITTADGADTADESRVAEPEGVGVKCVLLDIEGTICPISFVKDTLFPYALKALPDVLASKWDDTDFKPYRDAFPEEARASPASLQAYVEKLTQEDRKDACHKNLQGYLWENGYKTGAYSTPLFPDVTPRLKEWKDTGLTLAIYSSGSVFAQKLLFGHVQVHPPKLGGEELQDGEQEFSSATGVREMEAAAGQKRSIDEAEKSDSVGVASEEPPTKKVATADGDGQTATRDGAIEAAAGKVPLVAEPVTISPDEAKESIPTEDLQYLISDWFDTTNAGPKKEAGSYTKIAKALKFQTEEILFLTDSIEEYDAAASAGLKVGLMRREGNPALPEEEDPQRFQMMWSLQNAHPLRQNHGI